MTASFPLIQFSDSSLLPRLSDGSVFEHIAHTEQRENHGTIILDGVCYSVIHFYRVILSRMVESSSSQTSLDEYCLI